MSSRKTVDDYLNSVNYTYLNSNEYIPSEFALGFVNFIKLVNGAGGEESKTPAMHYKILDSVGGDKEYVANLCFRGASKTTILVEYLVLYLAVFGELPCLGKVPSMLYISDSMENGAKNARKNIQFRYENSEFLQQWIVEATFTDAYLEFTNKHGDKFGVKLYGAKTGLRGTKIFGKRPVLAIMDDLLKDSDANSPTILAQINNTIYRGVNHALNPKRRKVIISGTPFNMDDPMIKAVSSGQWEVNAFPVCEVFPCDKKDFSGAWEDRFNYEYVLKQYELALSVGQLAGFYQELMLRINTSDNRMVEDHDIRWYSRDVLLRNKHKFNFYITTDYATSVKEKSDFSVTSVWAYSSNGGWFWVDGYAKRQTMDKNINDLFRLVQEYNPLSVGIEINGQQGGFISVIQNEMLNRNSFFTLACTPNTSIPGIRNTTDKLTRFALTLPLFKIGKIQFPEEMRNSTVMGEFVLEMQLATTDGFKGHDDCLDTISMLNSLSPVKPFDYSKDKRTDNVYTYDDEDYNVVNNLASYIV